MSQDRGKTAQTRAPAAYAPRRRPRWGTLGAIIALHVLAIAGLVRVFAPDFTATAIESAASLVTVTVRTREPEPEPEPSAAAEEEAGAAGEAGREDVPKEMVAPEPEIVVPRPNPAPRASSTGSATRSGARDEGEGTGAGGAGDGTGAGGSGTGRGGGAVSGPSVRSGTIDAARDFPIPPGGREMRAGTSVTVAFTVGVDGRAFDCSILRPGPDPATNAGVCPLVIERIRFNPARDANGNPVPARYGWRQDFFRQ